MQPNVYNRIRLANCFCSTRVTALSLNEFCPARLALFNTWAVMVKLPSTSDPPPSTNSNTPAFV